MTKSLKTVVMPDGATCQILTSKPICCAVVFYNAHYDGWTIKRWEESENEAQHTWAKCVNKRIEQLGITRDIYDRKYLDTDFKVVSVNIQTDWM
tara:strand:- start:758 stop:1039 length:282 start_codon:yes stop_codon:yes gene_type:complete